MYQALYRKWRPLTFSDVVGQRHVTHTLKSELRAGRLSHAYLFTGTRGTGKTTCAKILARAVNCEHPADGDPCNVCPACRGILSGSVLDVTELDAASYSGVDNIRALRDETAYTPAAVKMRVYIIDEVHMLSIGAFNALLTILEEPPPHVLFILATTETHKVPATILSRCQRFAFRRISPADMLAHLKRVAKGEGIDLTDEAGRILARLADGALRDALSLLDQCATASRGRLDPPAVYASLGLAGLDAVSEMAAAVADRDPRRALALLQSLYESGRDLASVLDELCVLLRDLLLSIYLPGGEQSLSGMDTGGADARALADAFGKSRLLHAITLLQETQGLMARGGQRRVDMELCLLRLCDERLSGDTAALEARVAALERGHVEYGIQHAEIQRFKPDIPKEPLPNTYPIEPDVRGETLSPMQADTPHASRLTPHAAQPADAFWGQLLDSLGHDISFMTRAILSRARVGLAEHRLTISVEPFELKQVQNEAIVSLIGERAGRMLGHPAEVVVTTGGPPEDKKGPDPLDELIRRGGGIIQITNNR